MRNWVLSLLLFTLASSFLFFTDNRSRGWSDTHQYQIEARSWAKGERPPVADLLIDKENAQFVGPTHVPPLTPYIWSKFVSLGDPTKTLSRITLFQALLLSYCFILFVLIVGNRKVTVAGLLWGVLLFFHPFVRWWVYMPMSEPLALAIFLTGYYFAKTAGVAAALQGMTRPPVGLLHLPQLFSLKKNIFVWISFIFAASVGLIFFKDLILPSSFRGMGYNLNKSIQTLQGFFYDSSLIFNRLLPYKTFWFQVIWGILLTTFLIMIILKNYKKWTVWIAGIFYLLTIFLAAGEGFRYLFPFIVLLFVEFKPTLPKNKIIAGLLLILTLHVTFQHLEAIKELRGDRFPETDTLGLNQTRTWINENILSDKRLMMFRYRFCINYFDRPCVSIPLSDESILENLVKFKIRLVVVNQLYWQIEELDFEKRLLKELEAIKYPLNQYSRTFDNVRVIDVAPLPGFFKITRPKI